MRTPKHAEGEAFRRQLERRITQHAIEQAHLNTADDHVLHRRLNGRTVIQRRFWNHGKRKQ